MNSLQQYLKKEPMDEIDAMNYLQLEVGAISDRAVMAEDVHDDDCERAINELKLARLEGRL